MNKTTATTAAALAATGLAATTLALGLAAGPAQASGGDDDVRTSGTCSAGATWKLKAKADDGALEVEAEVDSNVVGQAWTWSLRDNGVRVGKGTSRTSAPSGSFEVEKHVADRVGTDTFTFRATYGGQVCKGTVAF